MYSEIATSIKWGRNRFASFGFGFWFKNTYTFPQMHFLSLMHSFGLRTDVCQVVINGHQPKIVSRHYWRLYMAQAGISLIRATILGNKSLTEFDLDTPSVRAGSTIDSKSAGTHNAQAWLYNGFLVRNMIL